MSKLPDPFDSQYKILSQKKHHKLLIGAGGGIPIKEMSAVERFFKKACRGVSKHFAE